TESLHGADGRVSSLRLEKALGLATDEPRRVQVLATDHGRRLGVYSRQGGDADATGALDATAELAVAAAPEVPAASASLPSTEQLAPRDVSELYAALAAVGLSYGASFQAIEQLWSGADEAIGRVRLAERLEPGAHGLHPALL